MCGSTNNARSAAFKAAAEFYSATARTQIGDAAPTGESRAYIRFAQSMGAGEPPVELVALADAEDAMLTQLREVQVAQQGIIERLLSGLDVRTDSSRVESFVATLNNLKGAVEAQKAAQKAYAAIVDETEPGTIADAPSTLQ